MLTWHKNILYNNVKDIGYDTATTNVYVYIYKCMCVYVESFYFYIYTYINVSLMSPQFFHIYIYGILPREPIEEESYAYFSTSRSKSETKIKDA